MTTPVAGLLLAAGRSTRMGGVSKLLRLAGGVVIVRGAALSLSRGVGGPITVVTGPDAAPLREVLAGIDANFVVNENPEAGMASSLAAGVAALPEARAVAVMLGDVPSVSPATVKRLAEILRSSGKSIVLPAFRGRRGHPVLFDLTVHREALLALTGDRGAREIVAANPDGLLEVETSDPGVTLDLDTPEELARHDREARPALARALGLGGRELVSLVGGGGKTTLMYRLARELSAGGSRVACATTTRIMPPSEADGAALRLMPEFELPPPEPGVIPVFCRRFDERSKLEGLPPEWCGRLFTEGGFDHLIVEADGSRRLPLKAPASHEPVVPKATTLFVAVAGLSALGKPLDGEHAFRPELISSLTGLLLGGIVGAGTVARLLTVPGGLFKGISDSMRGAALLNQADTPELAAAGRAIALKVLEAPGPADRVVVARVAAEDAVEEIWER